MYNNDRIKAVPFARRVRTFTFASASREEPLEQGTDMADLEISNEVSIPLSEVDMEAVRAQGAGRQNVNKVSTAIHLRFDIDASSLPEHYKRRLKALSDRRISGEGVIVIKAQRFRSQDKNREDAVARLQALVKSVAATRKKRKPTKPTRTSQRKRMDRKTRHGNLKSLRGKVTY